MPTPERKPRWFRQATFWVPTWRTVAIVLLLLVLLVWGAGRRAHAFLSVDHPGPANVLVAEGWVSDAALKVALQVFREGNYRYLVAAGGPMPKGYIVSGYETWAAISRDTLARLGAPPDTLLEAPGVKTYRQRTLESARAVRDRLRELGIRPQGINVISEGPHARRTWATYRRVFRGDAVPVGVINVPPQDYDPERWWASSDGVKNTIAEGLGWLYEALFSSGG